MSWTAWPEGLRASLAVALPTAAVGLSFGLLAAPVLGPPASVVMSAVVWSGTAQFAALSTLASGGGPALAAGTALLANTRFLPMGFAVAPSMTGSRLHRFLTGALLADASFVIAARPGGRFDVRALAWAAPVQWVSWLGGTVVGVVGARTVGDPGRWGLDVLFPVFYLSLLLPELFPHRARGGHAAQEPRTGTAGGPGLPLLAAAVAAAITLVLTPLAPPGVPVLAAAAAALLGLRPPRTGPSEGADR